MKPNRVKNTLKRPFSQKVVIKWLFRLLYGIGIGVIYYLLFSLFFDTPIEYEIKKSNQKLEEQYTILQQRYDSIHSLLDNIIERDKEIHKILFESEPYSTDQDSVAHDYTKDNELLNRTNMELGEEMISRVGQLYQKVYGLSTRLSSMQQYVADNRNEVNKIPAIQPITNPDFTLLATSFGERIHPFYKSMKMHKGIDYSVPVGTAVFATADGIVIEIQTRGQTTGTSVKVRHGNLYETYYANLSSVLVNVGQQIYRGDVIAFSGNTGLSFAPHLHYEVRYKGKAVDPINYFFLEVGIKEQEKLRRVAATGMQAFD